MIAYLKRAIRYLFRKDKLLTSFTIAILINFNFDNKKHFRKFRFTNLVSSS